MPSEHANAILLQAEHDGLHFTIETEGPEVGGYFLWTKRSDGSDIDEEFDDTIAGCKVRAFQMYGVPLESWHE
ncbi:MAG: hypothetical protein JST45_03780 [Bacteroidetes bacterium]|nr:hypothetical protein [Bacteroidota bacterium]